MKLILLLVIIMWGSNFVVYKILLENFPFWTLVFSRNFFAALALVWLVRKFLHIKPRNKKLWGCVLGATLLGVFINNVLFQYGLQYTLATNASLIMGLTPLTTALISYLVFHVPLHRKQILGVFLGFFGVFLIVMKGSLQNLLEFSFNIGDLFIVGTLLFFSLSFIFVKKATDTMFPAEIITLYGYTITSICLIPMVFWEQTTMGWGELPTGVIFWIMLLYVGIFPTGIGTLLWNRGISILGPSQAAIFMNGVPLVAAVASIWVLGEPILWFHIIGFLFIATGVILGSQNNESVVEKKNEDKAASVSI